MFFRRDPDFLFLTSSFPRIVSDSQIHFSRVWNIAPKWTASCSGAYNRDFQKSVGKLIRKTKQPSPCELGCLLIVLSAVD
jgi:hypothetical protein